MTEQTYQERPEMKPKTRRQKSTKERLDDKVKQLKKANDSLEVIQKKIKTLKEDIAILEGKRQQELLKEYDMSLEDLEALMAANKDR